MRYKKLTGVILKKQNYREADQILTLWTAELGKVRCIGRGLRRLKSKLIYNLQDLSLVMIEVAGRKNLPVLISAKTLKSFRNLREDLIKMSNAFYCCELMLKMTADEHPNKQAFTLLVKYLEQLDRSGGVSLALYSSIDQFALALAQTLGFGSPKQARNHLDIKNFIESVTERQIWTIAF